MREKTENLLFQILVWITLAGYAYAMVQLVKMLVWFWKHWSAS